jgi:hypothetical protein
MSADFWMNLQSAYELDLARQQSGKAIMRIPKRDDCAAAGGLRKDDVIITRFEGANVRGQNNSKRQCCCR